MQHHLDEFSVTDIRHTLGEAWRIVRERRWFFVFPFCIVSTVALVCSLWAPRQFGAGTIIKREHDPVFANMMGEGWTQPYNEIRQRMGQDIKDVATIEKVLDELKLPEGVERFGDGELTPRSQAARRRLAEEVSAGLSIKPLETSPARDVVSVGLTLSDPFHLPRILRGIRDHYIGTARERTVAVLQDVEQFFVAESDRCRAQLSGVQRRLLEYELQYPGINPDETDRTRSEEASLSVERIQLERSISELSEKRGAVIEEQTALSSPRQDQSRNERDILARQPNPRYQELQQEIDKLQREIADSRTLRFMTEQHPVILRLRARLGSLQEELGRTPRDQFSALKSAATPESAEEIARAAAAKLEGQLADLDSKIATGNARLAEIANRLAKLERGRALAVEHRQDYLKLKQETARLEAELQTWTQNVGPIRRVLTVEDRNRTIHFATVEDAKEIIKPILPTARTIMVICFGIGLAAGALAVLLIELVDRSYRTVRQLGSSLGVPVIEGVGEIITRATARKRFIRRLVLVPTAAVLAVGSVFTAATMAYRSVEKPSDYRTIKAITAQTCSLTPDGE